jgi:hypothetical protein
MGVMVAVVVEVVIATRQPYATIELRARCPSPAD